MSSVSELYPMEMQAVIDVAKELVEKNKVVKIERLFNIAKRRLKLSTEGLRKILKYLFENQILVEGSKMIKTEVLSNETRDLVYKFIKKYPGVNFSALKENLLSEFDKSGASVGTGQILWHLEVLMKFKCLKKVEFKNYTLYCPFNIEAEHAIYYFLMRDNINRKIINALVENVTLKQAQIPKMINELKGSVYYHIAAMRDVNLLVSEKNPGGLEVSIIQGKNSLVMEILGDVENKFHKLQEKYIGTKPKPKEVVKEKEPEVKSVPKVEEKAEEKSETEKEPRKEEKKKEPRKRVKTL